MNSEADTPGPELSLIIPAFNEERRLAPTLTRILDYLAARDATAEILVVDDGSQDATAEVALSFGDPSIRVITNARNRGKGYSVREGFRQARGNWVLFTDADLSTPIEELDTLLEAGKSGADVAIGSRALDRSRILVHQSPFREFGGIVFNAVVRLVLRLPIADTQCGFKLFRRKACEPLFRLQRVEGFGFDPEILYLARKAGLTTREVAVDWRNDEATKVRFLQDATAMFLNLLQIRWNWMRGHYRGLT